MALYAQYNDLSPPVIEIKVHPSRPKSKVYTVADVLGCITQNKLIASLAISMSILGTNNLTTTVSYLLSMAIYPSFLISQHQREIIYWLKCVSIGTISISTLIMPALLHRHYQRIIQIKHSIIADKIEYLDASIDPSLETPLMNSKPINITFLFALFFFPLPIGTLMIELIDHRSEIDKKVLAALIMTSVNCLMFSSIHQITIACYKHYRTTKTKQIRAGEDEDEISTKDDFSRHWNSEGNLSSIEVTL